ncbi:MAG TPA: hypothetical protein VK982_00950, partial [Bacteroidales bacterium]|nr:hypothetical protein [Bacteroidales bacterium]
VKDSEGLSFAHLKELFISAVLFGNDYKESLDKLIHMGEPDQKNIDANEMYDLEDMIHELTLQNGD